MGWDRLDWSGPFEMVRGGRERMGLERMGLERMGLEQMGLERMGLERMGLERMGLERTGQDGMGSCASGMGRGFHVGADLRVPARITGGASANMWIERSWVAVSSTHV